MKKLLLTIILTTAAAAFAGTVGDLKGGDAADFGKRFRDRTADTGVVSDGNYYAPGGYYVGASPGSGQRGYIYPSKEAAEAAEHHHTVQVNDWKVGPPGPKQTEDWGKPATKPINLVGRLLGVFGHLFGK